MTALPDVLATRGLRMLVGSRRPAWLRVGDDGRVEEAGGDLARYDLAGLVPGADALETAPFLTGLLPGAEHDLFLPLVQLHADCHADLYVFKQDRGTWVLLLLADHEASEHARFQQAKNELMLEIERGGELAVPSLLHALDVIVPEHPWRDRASESSSPVTAMSAAELLSALDIGGFVTTDAICFRPLDPLPVALTRRFPSLAASDVELGTIFGFLGEFLREAAPWWTTATGEVASSCRSGLWHEIDASGQGCWLEATAVRLPGRRLLLLELAGDRHEHMRTIMQIAREDTLAIERLQRTEAALRQNEIDLERRVDERTAELVQANRRLSRESTRRQQAVERMAAYQEELRALADRLTGAEEGERRRIATALHDHVGQHLAAAKIQLGMLGELATSPDLRGKVDELRSLIEETIGFTRTLTFELSPPVLYELGLGAALESLTGLTRERFGIDTAFHDDGADKPIADDTRSVLFQATRELVHNVVKHAAAPSMTVSLRRDGDDVVVTVEDDGAGFRVAAARARARATGSGGFGLFNIQERVGHCGGSVAIDSQPGSGTRVTLRARIDRTPADG